MKLIKVYFLLFLAVLIHSKTNAQVTVNAVLDSGKIRIGEQTKIDLFLNYNIKEKNLKFEWPHISDTLKKEIEVVHVSPIDTTIPDKKDPNRIQQHLQITVTAFDSGYFAIAPFEFIRNGDTTHPLLTEPLLLEVHTIPTDTSIAKIKDIKPPFDEPFDWKWYLPYFYWGFGILAIIIVAIYIFKRYFKNKPAPVLQPEPPKVPPHITALELLEKIKESAVWKEGKNKEYYSAIADTIRFYIEGRFRINALELTSDEVLSIFKNQVVDQDSKDKLKQILTISDLVKFAKNTPIEAEHLLTLNNAFDFVNTTKREFTEEDIKS